MNTAFPVSGTVYVNGSYLPAAEATVSVFDRGFLFGDGIYEVIPVINGALVDKAYFLQRLRRSLAELQIAWPCSEEAYFDMMTRLIGENDLAEGVVYSQVTRGVAARNFYFPADTPSTLVAFTSEMALLDNPAAETGIRVVTTPDLRWKRRDIKSVNLLGQVLAKQDAVTRNADEGWMVENGIVTEGVSSTAYIVKDGVVITRHLSNEILPGIRRRTLLELGSDAGIGIEERTFTVEEALAADEAFISSATTLALAVVEIDGSKIGNGRPGPVTRQLRDIYKRRILAEAEAS